MPDDFGGAESEAMDLDPPTDSNTGIEAGGFEQMSENVGQSPGGIAHPSNSSIAHPSISSPGFGAGAGPSFEDGFPAGGAQQASQMEGDNSVTGIGQTSMDNAPGPGGPEGTLQARGSVTLHPSPPDPASPWYSDITGRYYGSVGEAQWDEHQWQGRFRQYVPGAGIGYEPPDPDWDPQANFHQRMQTSAAGGSEPTSYEQLAKEWRPGDYWEISTDTGPVTIRKGMYGGGRQPYLQSRQDNYSGAQVSEDYDDISSVLDRNTFVDDPQNEGLAPREELASRILEAMDSPNNRQDLFVGYDAYTQRAVAHFIGITQIVEENPSRTPGSAEFARAGMVSVANGTDTFTSAFNRTDGKYTPARKKGLGTNLEGGTQQMRDAANGTIPVDDMIAGLMEEE